MPCLSTAMEQIMKEGHDYWNRGVSRLIQTQRNPRNGLGPCDFGRILFCSFAPAALKQRTDSRRNSPPVINRRYSKVTRCDVQSPSAFHSRLPQCLCSSQARELGTSADTSRASNQEQASVWSRIESLISAREILAKHADFSPVPSV